MVRNHLVGGVVVMMLTDEPVRLGVGLHDVVRELSWSSRRRSDPAAVVDEPGLVGVISGAAPVLFVAPWADRDRALDIVSAAPSLHEVQVAGERHDVASRLRADGWISTGHEDQVVLDRQPPPAPLASPYRIRPLVAAHMPRVRELIMSAFDVPRSLVDASYPDDFHVHAAPVSLIGAVDGRGDLVGCIGWRRQRRSAMVFALAVAPEHRQHGLATALVTAATRDALASGASFVHALAGGASQDLARRVGARRVGTWEQLLRPAR